MFSPSMKKSFREIDYGCAAKINLERRFLDRRPIHLEMKSGIGVRAVVPLIAIAPRFTLAPFLRSRS